jgi:hypothetical protein
MLQTSGENGASINYHHHVIVWEDIKGNRYPIDF